MIVDLIDKLLTRLIQLKAEQNKHKSTLYAEFLKPINEGFEAIHKEYMTSFRSYKEELNTNPEGIDKLLQRISDDRIFNDFQRLKMLALISDQKLTAFKEYLSFVAEYFLVPTALEMPPDPTKQQRQQQQLRRTLIEKLRDAMTPDTDNRYNDWTDSQGVVRKPKVVDLPDLVARANAVFDVTIEEMQDRYGKAQDAMVPLKSKLVLPN